MRVPRMRKFIRWLFMLVLCMFVILNLHILVNFQPEMGSADSYHEVGSHVNAEEAHVQNRETAKRTLMETEANNKSQFIIPPNFFKNSSEEVHTDINVEDLAEIEKRILKINTEQKIRNLYQYGLTLNSESVVIVVQVHDRLEYLRILLESLRDVKEIHNSLLVISHDVYSEDMNKLVRTVDFCPVLQIFFPHSHQLHPHSFPGEDPNDCPRNMKKEEAIKVKCKNAAYPDKYGHYREARYCQTKHHWMWKLHHVFDELTVMKDYRGLVLLLEEDYYVTPDIISVLQMMHNLKNKDCKECKILAAGNYDKTQNYGINAGKPRGKRPKDHVVDILPNITDARKVEVANWISSRHNMGMAFTSDLWLAIKNCAKEFCYFDDYNWDWTLQHLASKCIPNQMKVLKMKATRVFHMGECGVHHKGKNCKPEEKKKTVLKLIEANKQHLFPNTVTIGGYSGLKLRDPKPNGGWGDLRDRQLCMSFMTNTTVPVIR